MSLHTHKKSRVIYIHMVYRKRTGTVKIEYKALVCDIKCFSRQKLKFWGASAKNKSNLSNIRHPETLMYMYVSIYANI